MQSPIQHLAIIMDGNRRWAKERGLPSFDGHKAGYDRLKQVGEWCLDRGINVLTVYAFSTENWKRTQEEVGYLMDLLEFALVKELNIFMERNVRIRVLGRRTELRPSALRAIEEAERATAQNTRATLCLCVNYGGRTEIVDACRSLIAQGVKPEDVTEATVQQQLYWSDMPEPELVIRTSGEQRLSGFLTWESVYSEIYWSHKHWPDFDEQELDAALADYAARQRRFGK